MEGFSHQQGHIAAALYSAGKLELLEERFLAFHVSGGTTEALLVTPGEKGVPQVKLVAHSLDLKAGQAVDRVGVMLGAWVSMRPGVGTAGLEVGREDPIPPGAERQRLFSLRH